MTAAAAQYATGADKRHSLKAEATFDVQQAIVAADSAALIADSVKITPEQAKDYIRESHGGASQRSVIRGATGGKYQFAAYGRTKTAGNAPTIGVALKAAFGGEAIVGGTSVTYNLTDASRYSFLLSEQVGTSIRRDARGCWVEQLVFEYTPNSLPQFQFSGGFATHIHAFGALIGTGGAPGGTGACPINALHKGNFSVDSYVKVGTSDNTGAGHRVTAVDWTSTPPSITVSPNISGAQAEDLAVLPFSPTAAAWGDSFIDPTQYALTIDTVSLGLIKAKITLSTGLHGRDKDGAKPSGILGGAREVSYEFQCYFIDQTTAPFIGKANIATARDIDLRVGANTAGQRFSWSIPAGDVDVTEVDVPGTNEALVTIKGRALINAANADELVLAYN